jgi:hypothetical protein
MSTAIYCKQTWNGRCRNWQVWDGICKNMKFRSTKVLVVQLWQFSPIWAIFRVPFSFWSALYQHDNAQQIWLNVCSAIILIFFLQFFSSFLIWSTSDLSHKTHIWSFSCDPLLTFLPSSLGCIFICFLFLHLNYQTMLYKKNYHLLWVCSNLK